MKIGKAYEGCRYWAYHPVKPEGFNVGDYKDRKAKREEYQNTRRIVETAGYRAEKYDLTKAQAIADVKALEKRFPDIEWFIENYDYL